MKFDLKAKSFLAIGETSQKSGTPFKRYVGVGEVYPIALNPTKEELEKLYGRELNYEPEYFGTDDQIAAIEAGIVSIIGFHVTDLVKKVIEPNDKGIKETKYLPTDIVSYDTTTKEFVVIVPDEEESPAGEPECPAPKAEEPAEEEAPEEVVEEPVEEEEASEREAAEAEAEDNPNQLPW